MLEMIPLDSIDYWADQSVSFKLGGIWNDMIQMDKC